MRLSRQTQIFLRKGFATQNKQNKQKPVNKIKQANIKQVRQQILVHKNLISGENWLICFFSLYYYFQIQISMSETVRTNGKGSWK